MSYNILPRLQVQTDLDLTTATLTGFDSSDLPNPINQNLSMVGPKSFTDRLGATGTNGQVLSKDGTGLVWSTPASSVNLPATTFNPNTGNLPTNGDITWTTGATADYVISGTNIELVNVGTYLITFSISATLFAASNSYNLTMNLGGNLLGSLYLQSDSSGGITKSGSFLVVASTLVANEQLSVNSFRILGSSSLGITDSKQISLTIVKIG